MGSGQSKSPPPDCSITKLMRRKYGDECVSCLHDWTKHYGFQEGGSLSVKDIRALKEKLEEKEKQLRKSKTIKVKTLEEIELNNRCLEIWVKEFERRERLKCQKELGGRKDESGDVAGRKDNNSVEACTPPPYTHTHTQHDEKQSAPTVSALYPFAELSAVKVNPDLDSFYVSRKAGQGGQQDQQPDQQQLPAPHQQPAPLQQPGPHQQPGQPLLSGAATSAAEQSEHVEDSVNATPTPGMDVEAFWANSPVGFIPTSSTATGSAHAPTATTSAASATTSVRTLRSNTPVAPVISLPMVEVAGPEGSMLVHRPWTSADIADFAQNLPDITVSGKTFGANLLAFCQEYRPTGAEIRRILAKRLAPCEYQKLARQLPDVTLALKHKDWTNNLNDGFVTAVRTLVAHLETAFPDKVCMIKVTTCKQQPEESVDDFVHRLTTTYNTHGGVHPPPEGVGGLVCSTYESHLCELVMKGLLPEVFDAVKQSYIGWKEEARLSDLTRHARHAYDTLQQRKMAKKEKQQSELYLPSLEMFSAMHNNNRGAGRFRGRGRRDFRRNWPNRDTGGASGDPGNACHICGEMGHWKKHCPRLRQVPPSRALSSD
ncbi:uncharacterized protein LOC129605132 isoform X2 [Betta splendens]|uniref:Uncharacterized protein LOC129605132 isoform X2 n=1 Tax=Betta splendens TaxID=158456 RepID=A0A9W2Y9K5_BETSP|nr:uncharacterized protein LOC129605132 isoform X2 [Betta splendens]